MLEKGASLAHVICLHPEFVLKLILFMFCSFEKRSEFERDVRARNVTALHRHEAEEDIQVSSRKRQPVTAIETATEKAAKKQDTNPYSSNETNSAVASWRKSREAARQNVNKEPEPEKKSWRERMAER